MSKRSLAQNLGGLFMGSLGFVLIGLALLIMLVRAYPLQIALIVIGFFAFAWVLKDRSAKRREAGRRLAQDCVRREVERHRSALLSYFNQSIRTDLFGNEDSSLWRRHIGTFLETQVLPALKAASVQVNSDDLEWLAREVDAAVRAEAAEARASGRQPDFDPARISAREYEEHCASILFRSGWTVHPTPVTGDHGADVVAEKDGRRLVLQCKLYSKPVGNKAVQEVYSARPLYGCDHACVVAPSGFTPHAERAAHALSVGLLHHSDLEAFAKELFEAPR